MAILVVHFAVGMPVAVAVGVSVSVAVAVPIGSAAIRISVTVPIGFQAIRSRGNLLTHTQKVNKNKLDRNLKKKCFANLQVVWSQ